MISLSDLADEITKICLEGKNGALLISNGRSNGKIFIANGNVVNLEFANQTGQTALATIGGIAQWNYAIFVAGQVKPSADPDLPGTDQLLRGLRVAPSAPNPVVEPISRRGAVGTGLPPAEKLEEIIRAQLAQRLGPVANIIVKQQHGRIVALQGRDELDRLLRELAAKISDPAAASSFVSAVSNQIRT